MQWSIDSADAYSVASVRRSVIDELQQGAGPAADLFTLEVVLGELLAAEMERGHFSLAVSLESNESGPSSHIYAQGPPAIRCVIAVSNATKGGSARASHASSAWKKICSGVNANAA